MKTNLDKMFKTNDDYERNGVWFEITDDTAFLVKRFGGKNGASIKEAHAKHMKPHARKLENGSLSEKKERALLTKFFIDSCLMDWRGVEIDEVATDYSKEAAIKLFEGLPDLLSSLLEDANNLEYYKEAEREEVGNS